MRFSLSLSVHMFGLSSVFVSVHSFPTPENIANIIRREELTPEQLHESLLRLKDKRLLFDPLTTPIEGRYSPSYRPVVFVI
jgi:hypothetical protein